MRKARFEDPDNITIGKGRVISIHSWGHAVWTLPGQITTYNRDEAEAVARNIDTITTLQEPGAAEQMIEILRRIAQ